MSPPTISCLFVSYSLLFICLFYSPSLWFMSPPTVSGLYVSYSLLFICLLYPPKVSCLYVSSNLLPSLVYMSPPTVSCLYVSSILLQSLVYMYLQLSLMNIVSVDSDLLQSLIYMSQLDLSFMNISKLTLYYHTFKQMDVLLYKEDHNVDIICDGRFLHANNISVPFNCCFIHQYLCMC